MIRTATKIATVCLVLTLACPVVLHAQVTDDVGAFDLIQLERPRILEKAERYLEQAPRTVTADSCDRSAGGPHDYYSEGDYWWPNPEDPDGPYIRRDGETNHDNFIAHRRSLIHLSEIVGTLTSAYLVTEEEKYAEHAVAHLKAWFVDEKTRMNPNLLYGQAIKGRHTGRSIGIIDTLHLVEVARGAQLLGDSASFSEKDQNAVRGWFKEYLNWINTHEYGKKEKHHPNNHGVCWSLQAAAFADLVGDEEQLAWIRNQFKTVYLKEMMDNRGGFPAELERTKPYGYSLFVIDAMAGVAQIASTPEDDLWTFQLPDGRGMELGMRFITPYIKDKSNWPFEPDIMYWDEWPVRHPSLLFAGLKFGEADYLSTWESLKADPTTFEVLRNLPLRHPLLWVDSQAAVSTDSRTLTQLATEVCPGFLLGTHFGPIFAADTPENEKPRSIISSQYNLISVGIYPRHTTQRESRDGWDFTTVDQTVQFAEENGLRVYAHPMFGSDNYLPDWLLKGDYSNDELLEIIEERIKVILTRYKGRIHILDVYNEGLDRGESGEWRKGDNFFLKLGWNENEYGRWPIALEKMLVWCRKYGGDELKLVYNDNRNTLHGAPQSLACIKMVKALKHAGIPIDGIGIQCHTRIMEDGVHYTNGHLRAGNTPFDAESFARNIRAMGEAGVDVHISECDVHLYGPVDAKKLELQAEAYRNMLKACIQEPACKSFKTWGFTDASCWKAMKKSSGWGYDYEPYPLVYDHDYQPKPAYHAMRELLLTLSMNKNKATPR